MLCKCSGKYIDIYFILKITFFYSYLVLSNFLLLFVLLLFSFISEVFSFLTGLSSLLGPSGFRLLTLPVVVCSLECNNNNNNMND